MNGTAGQAALDSLRGLALGDTFGGQWFPRRNPAPAEMIRNRQISTAPRWRWSDDTATASSVLRALELDGEIDQHRLAGRFGTAYLADGGRKYGSGMRRLLPRLAAEPESWPTAARDLFDGQGSLGNGAAMRVAPLGAWFRADPDRAAEQAVLSAAALAAGFRGAAPTESGESADSAGSSEPKTFLLAVAERTPPSAVRDGVTAPAELDSPDLSAAEAAEILGSGRELRADDTVPFAPWSAARNLNDLVGALWCTAEGLGDVDTTCAITGGVVAARTGLAAVPEEWWERCEPLPDDWTDTHLEAQAPTPAAPESTPGSGSTPPPAPASTSAPTPTPTPSPTAASVARPAAVP